MNPSPTGTAWTALLEGAEWDLEGQTVTLAVGSVCDSRDDLVSALAEAASAAWYACVPNDGGETLDEFDLDLVDDGLQASYYEGLESMGWGP
jgi:hypothetical protein